jgi:hypothetical protein
MPPDPAAATCLPKAWLDADPSGVVVIHPDGGKNPLGFDEPVTPMAGTGALVAVVDAAVVAL